MLPFFFWKLKTWYLIYNYFYFIHQSILIMVINYSKMDHTINYIKTRMYDVLVRLTQLLCICHYVNMVICSIYTSMNRNNENWSKTSFNIIPVLSLDTLIAAIWWTFVFTCRVFFYRLCRYLQYYYYMTIIHWLEPVITRILIKIVKKDQLTKSI